MTTTATRTSANGGTVFVISPMDRLIRFLTIGTEGGTYYAAELKLTRENAKNAEALVKSDGMAVLDTVIDISVAGRAPKQSPAIFVLAMCAGLGTPEVKARALSEGLPKVCRTGSHLLEFASYIELFRGWGRGLRSGVAAWYNSKPVDELSYQLVKYQNRYGWTHGDLLSLAHPWAGLNLATTDPLRDELYKWATGKAENAAAKYVKAFKDAQLISEGAPASVKAQFIRGVDGFSHEMIPTDWKREVEVWAALLEGMPLHAMLRNLGNMSKVGLLTPKANATQKVLAELGNQERLNRSRVHPMDVLKAYLIYKQGHGDKGSGTWSAVPQLVDALDAAFYLTFGNVIPANKRMLIGLDVSGSMSWSNCGGVAQLTPALASAAMCLIHVATEPDVQVMAFADHFKEIKIAKGDKLQDVLKRTERQNFGGTDCALPYVWAKQHRKQVDTFITYTDSETSGYGYGGRGTPADALREYRQATGLPAKGICVGMTASDSSVADPNDGGMLDVAGFDSAAPNIINEFARG